jgi:hypothetical protein
MEDILKELNKYDKIEDKYYYELYNAILDKKKILDTDLNDDIFNKVLKKYEGLKYDFLDCLEDINKELNEYLTNYDYKQVVKRITNKNEAYGVCTFNMRKLNKSNYILSASQYVNKNNIKTNTLTFNLKYDYNNDENNDKIDRMNVVVKDTLRNCYDNIIIFDLGYNIILVLENIPLYKYFSLIDNDKNNFYNVKPYYYKDDKYYKYIYKPNYKLKEDEMYLYELLKNIKYDGKKQFNEYIKKHLKD